MTMKHATCMRVATSYRTESATGVHRAVKHGNLPQVPMQSVQVSDICYLGTTCSFSLAQTNSACLQCSIVIVLEVKNEAIISL